MKILHTMIRVGNLEKSIEFYRDALGLEVIKNKEYPEGKFTLVFMAYSSSPEEVAIELTHNWDKDQYELGTGFGHIAIGAPDIYKVCEDIASKGYEVSRQPGPMKGGTKDLAFVKDPDGYSIELIQI